MMNLLKFAPNLDVASLIFRVSLGGMFFLHGIGKPLVVGMEEVSRGFVEQGFSVWTSYASTGVEIVAGLLLVLGSFSRLAALALLPVSLGILVYHFPNGWVFHEAGGGWEYPQLVIVSLLVVLSVGSSRYALTPHQ